MIERENGERRISNRVRFKCVNVRRKHWGGGRNGYFSSVFPPLPPRDRVRGLKSQSRILNDDGDDDSDDPRESVYRDHCWLVRLRERDFFFFLPPDLPFLFFLPFFTFFTFLGRFRPLPPPLPPFFGFFLDSSVLPAHKHTRGQGLRKRQFQRVMHQDRDLPRWVASRLDKIDF